MVNVDPVLDDDTCRNCKNKNLASHQLTWNLTFGGGGPGLDHVAVERTRVPNVRFHVNWWEGKLDEETNHELHPACMTLCIQLDVYFLAKYTLRKTCDTCTAHLG